MRSWRTVAGSERRPTDWPRTCGTVARLPSRPSSRQLELRFPAQTSDPSAAEPVARSLAFPAVVVKALHQLSVERAVLDGRDVPANIGEAAHAGDHRRDRRISEAEPQRDVRQLILADAELS